MQHDKISPLAMAFLMSPTYLVSFSIQMNRILTYFCVLAPVTLFPSHLCITLFFLSKSRSVSPLLIKAELFCPFLKTLIYQNHFPQQLPTNYQLFHSFHL